MDSHSSTPHNRKVFVVSDREPTPDGESAQAGADRAARNADRDARRQAEANADAAEQHEHSPQGHNRCSPRHCGVCPRNLDPGQQVDVVNVFNSLTANVSAIFADLEQIPQMDNIKRVMARLRAVQQQIPSRANSRCIPGPPQLERHDTPKAQLKPLQYGNYGEVNDLGQGWLHEPPISKIDYAATAFASASTTATATTTNRNYANVPSTIESTTPRGDAASTTTRPARIGRPHQMILPNNVRKRNSTAAKSTTGDMAILTHPPIFTANVDLADLISRIGTTPTTKTQTSTDLRASPHVSVT